MTQSPAAGHQQSEAEEQRLREAALDRTIEATFPASDPLSTDPNPDAPEAVTPQPRSAGDTIPSNCEVIEIRVSELKQLFNAIDPSPFRERDLDPKAEEFIVGWAKEAPTDATLALVVHLDRPAGLPNEPALLREAIAEFFTHRGQEYRRNLRDLFGRGRTSLLIGLAFLAASLALSDAVARMFGERAFGQLLHESLLISGWVAMWRPMEIFLYDWWPLRAEALLSDRLATMPVRIEYSTDRRDDAWRWDWPAAPPNVPTPPALRHD